MADKPLHVLVGEGATACGLKNRTEGLRPHYAHLATCKRCIASLRKLARDGR
jgi:hypothetical protein